MGYYDQLIQQLLPELLYFYPMQRLYKFFLLLFVTLFLVSFLYGTAISFGFLKFLQLTDGKQIIYGNMPLGSFLKFGLVHGFIYTLVQFLTTLLLFRLSFRHQLKFSIGQIVNYHLWFLLITALVYLLFLLAYLGAKDLTIVFLLGGPLTGMPAIVWLPFLLAWVVLYILLAEKIKRKAAYGRQD